MKNFSLLHSRVGSLAQRLMVMFCVLMLAVTQAWAVDASAYKTATLSGSSFSANSNSYTGSFNSTTNGFTVNIANANNNNKSWNYIKIGGKGGAYTGTIITDAAINKRITRVELVIDGITTSNVTSIKLYKATSKTGTWTEIGSFDKSTGTKVVNIAAAKQAANLFYKIEVVCTKGSSNGLILISAVKFYRSTFTVSYNSNGGSGTMTDNSSPYDTASTVTVKTNTFTAPANKAFDGWKTGASSGTSYAAGATFNISANTTLYAQWISTAACEATPTVGVASLKGTFNLSQVGVQCASASAGDNCELLYWGFVYGTSNTGGHPNIYDNSVYAYENYSDNYTNTLIPIGGAEKFTTGQTIYYRGFAMNENETEGEEYGYSSAIQSFTPQEVLFYKEKTLDNELAYKIVNKGTKVTAPSDPTMTGYTFAGWKNADGDAAFNCATTDIDDDYILYADWTINSHNLTWSTDGNTLEGDYTGKSGKVNFGTTIVAPNTPTKTGYTFKAWSPTVAGTMPDNNVTYTATWTAKTTNITLNKNNEDASGSNAGSVNYTYDQSTKNSYVTAARTGYTLNGYYTATSGGTKILNADGSIAANNITVDAVVYTNNDGKWAYDGTSLTLYAQWTENKYTISYDKNGGGDGTGTTGHSNVNWSASVTLNSCGFTAPAHKYFLGWDTDKDATSATYSAGASVSKLSNTNGATVTLYAIWANHTFTNYRTLCCTSWDDPEVSYSSSSINVAGTATVSIEGTTHGTVSYESSNTGVLTVASNGTVTGVGAGSAHVILHWAEADGYCEKTMNSEDITVLGEVTVTFNKNGGSGTMDDQEITVGDPTNLSANAFTAPSSCKYFYGWATSQALADVGTRAYEDGEEVTITERMDLYAIWKTYRYTIATPTKVGAETATLDYSEVDCNGEVTVTCTADASHKGDPTITITPSDAGTVNGNKIQNIVKNITAVTVTYTAKEVYTVTWKVGNDALEDDDLDGATVSVTEGEVLETLPPNPSGTKLSGADTFMGWSTSELSGLGNSAPSDLFTAASGAPTITKDTTFHAVFATQTAEESDSWDLCSAVNDVTAGDYVITWNNEKYLPSETTAASHPSVGTGITVSNNKLTNTVTSDMQWNFSGNNTNGWTVSHKKDSKTRYLGSTDAADGITVAESNSSYTWKVSLNNTYGMLMQGAGTTRYLTVYTPNSGTQTWRYYTTPNGTFRLYRHNVTEAAYANYITKVVALSSIAISAEAGKTIKTVYKKGETLDLTNMVVTATYADETSRAVTGYTVDLDGALSTDDTKFVVTYEENGVSKTAEQAIKVYELSGIAITAGPTTTTYKSGATLSTEGMVVTATWGGEALDKIVETVTGYTVDPSTNLATTDTEFEVSYTHENVTKTATKAISVYDLSGITITTTPNKTTYTAGDVFAPAGMVVTATWGNNSFIETVSGYTYSEEPLVNDADDPANVDVTISYTSNGVTKTATQEVTVNPKAKKIMTWHVANEDPFTTRIYINDQSKYILALPDDPDPVAAGFTSDYVFKGWTTATSVNKDGSDFTKVNAGAEMDDDEDFYAVFAQKNGEDRAAGYRIVDEAPAVSETVIIARKVSSTYYAMTNSATPGYDALTITNGVISGTTTSYQWSVASATNGVYLKKSSDYLHLNSGALKVASSTDNGDIIFTANNGTYTANLSGNNSRWIIASGDYGFGCGASENATALYIFKYAAATVATYSNYRLVPSTVAVPTGLEAGTYYCESKSITLSQAAGKPIYYTLDGSTPDKNATQYSSAIVLNTSKTIKAVAYDSNLDDYSGVASAEYTIVTSIDAPTMPATQTFYDESMEAEISHDLTSEGAVIHYSYDDASYSNYSDALTIDETKTVYAYATIGELTSPKASATYTKGVTYTYKKVTSDAGLAVGMKFIIVSGTNGAGAMSSNYLNVVPVPSPNAQSEIAITNQAVKEFTLSGRSGAYQLVSDQGALGSDAAKSLSYTEGTKTWTISYSGVQVTVTNKTTSYGSLKCNTAANPSRFNTYESGQSAIDIYALPFTAHTLTVKNYEGDKLTAKVVEGGSFVLTNDDKPNGYPATYEFLYKWTDGTNTYAVGDAVPMGNADVTLQPCWKVTPTANTDINTLPTSVTEIVVEDGKTLTIGADRNLDNLTVEAGGTVSGSGALSVNDLTINTEAGKSGQVMNTPNVSGDIYLEIKLDASGTMDPHKWYCISAPFNVAINGGFFWKDGTPMVLNTDFQLFEWDGDRRATGASGWRRTSSNMKAGIAYFIGFDDENTKNQNTIKLKAMSNTISSKGSIEATAHSGSAGSDYANWNGLANPNFHYVGLDQTVQVFDASLQGYDVYPFVEAGTNYGFVVGTAFFYKGVATIDLNTENHEYLRAPKREKASEKYDFCVEIAKEGASRYDNRLFVQASEDAESTYTEGKDLITLNSTTSKYGALLWTENYGGKRLAIEEAPLINGTASYVLTLSAPADGTYTLSVAEAKDNADLYLTYDGAIIWNLSMGEYEIDLNKGMTNGYGLLLKAKAPGVATGIENGEVLNGANGVQKIIVDDKVFILRGGQMYDVTGKAVK